MLRENVSRRAFLRSIGAVATVSLVAACAPVAAPGGGGEAAAPAKDAKYTILHWAQGAEPSDPNQELAEGEKPRVAYQVVADQYM